MVDLPRLISSDNAFSQRRKQYALNRAYYDGDETRPLGARRSWRRRNLTGLLIDTIVDHMGQAETSFGEEGTENAADQYVAGVLKANDSEALDHQSELDATIDGDGAWKVTWDDQQKRVRVVQVDPETLWVRAAPDDPTEARTIAQRFDVTPEDSPFLLPDGRMWQMPSNRTKLTVTEAWTLAEWQLWFGDQLAYAGPNPYGLIPYVTWPNLRARRSFWGVGDPPRWKDLQDAYNLAANDHDWLQEVSSTILAVTGAETGEMAIVPGTVLELPDASRAEVLNFLAEDLTHQKLAHLDHIRRDMFNIARVPETALGGTGRELSGLALEIELAPLLRLVARKRLTRNAAHRRRAEVIATLGMRFDSLAEQELKPPRVTWSEPLPTDTSRQLDNALKAFAIGRSRRELLFDIGVEQPDEELAARVLEDIRLGATPHGTREPNRSDDHPAAR